MSLCRVGLLRLVGACAACSLLAVGEKRVESDFVQTGECTNKFRTPQKIPRTGTYYNGLIMNDTCFSGPNRSKDGNPVFLIGDWGGINYGHGPVPADHTKTHDPAKRRAHNWVVDTSAQQRVAGQFNSRAKWREPDYVLNVGDNFYWGGVECTCGRPMWDHCDTAQWRYIYEQIYRGPGVDGVQWLSVLGNHDWGGWRFDKGWDQAIAYTWGGLPESTGRWVQPALFYKARVLYDDFKVDYFFLDTNIFDVKDNPWFDPVHNICGTKHAFPWSGCGEEGPVNAWDCSGWFSRIWKQQQTWMEDLLKQSNIDKVDWQVIVTHFPPWWAENHWKYLAQEYGIELFITGHVHRQDVLNNYRWDNQFKPTVVVITGGGGGITSEQYPNNAGWDDQYGFMDMTIWKNKIKIEAISHGGHTRSTSWVSPRKAKWQPEQNDTKLPTSKEDCNLYMSSTGCSWTAKSNCPGQPAGKESEGVASDVSSVGYQCCCNLFLWLTPAAVEAPTSAPVVAPVVPPVVAPVAPTVQVTTAAPTSTAGSSAAATSAVTTAASTAAATLAAASTAASTSAAAAIVADTSAAASTAAATTAAAPASTAATFVVPTIPPPPTPPAPLTLAPLPTVPVAPLPTVSPQLIPI